MICNQCGQEIQEDSAFCVHCGAKQETEASVSYVPKKRHVGLVALLAAVVVCIALTAVFIVLGGSDKRKIQEQLDLGAKYLEELNYEQAILQYKLVLETDIQNKEALTKISEAYGLMAETETEYEGRIEAYDMAIEYALSACEYYPEDTTLQEMLVSTYMNAGDYCLKNENLDDAEKYYTEGKEWAEKFSLTDKISLIDGKLAEIEQIKKEIAEAKAKAEAEAKRIQEEKERNERLLKPIYDAYLAGDMDKVRELSWNQELMDIAATLNAEDSIYFGETDTNGNRNGIGVAVYKNDFVYLGEWENGIREGQGYWLHNFDSYFGKTTKVYNCTWKENKPNGWMIMNWYYEKQLMEENQYRDISVEGNVIDGLFDGEIIAVWQDKDEERLTWPIHFKEGIVQVITRDGSDNIVTYANEDGSWYCWSDEQVDCKHGIVGFSESGL